MFSDRGSRQITQARIRETELLTTVKHRNVMRLIASETEVCNCTASVLYMVTVIKKLRVSVFRDLLRMFISTRFSLYGFRSTIDVIWNDNVLPSIVLTDRVREPRDRVAILSRRECLHITGTATEWIWI